MLFFNKNNICICFFVFLQKNTTMEHSEVKQLYDNSLRNINAVSTDYLRYLYKQINWKNRLIGIMGARGVGKTTLVLQHIKLDIPELSKVLYVSMDDLWFSNHSVFELVEHHYTHGGTYIFFDEIHQCNQWQTILKNLYDRYPDLHIVYTGSSMLEIDIHGADLSRRQRLYTLAGMSFREFLSFGNYLDLASFPLEEILKFHLPIAMEVTSQIKIIPLFEQYLRYGYYPYFAEEGDGFYSRLQSAIRQVLENDLPKIEDVSFATIQKIKKMLMILAERVPQTPKMTELYNQLETGRDQGQKMLYLLERAGLISLLSNKAKSLKHLPKPDKIYLDNPNLMYGLSQHIDKGTIREVFFNNQLQNAHQLLLPSKGDFMVDDKYLFEIGGKSKDYNQIAGIENSYLAIDDTEYGLGNRIPLWMFGLLY